jgi:RsiW-degrading membrane proteinase PrsW (M82 family)
MRCEQCGHDVPEGVFCTHCGAHQGTPGLGDPKRRLGHFAAHPGEHVLQPAIFTTLFPHLGHRKLHEFRWVFYGGIIGVFALFFAGLITAALCVSVMLLPILYLLYLYEAQVYREEPLPVLALIVIVSIALGVGVTIGTDQLISAEGQFSFAVTGGALATIGVLIPLIQEAVKPLPALALRVRPAFRLETMDGLVLGVAAGLGFGVGESFVRLSKIIVDLPVRTTPGNWIFPLLTTAVFLPLLQGTAAGLVCAALWRFARGRVDVLALLGITLALAGHIAFNLVSQVLVNHGWSQLIVLAWEGAVDVVLLLYLRILLHNALLDEAADLGVESRYCSHCHNTLTAEGFCPSCGMALSAVPFHTRPAAAGAQ